MSDVRERPIPFTDPMMRALFRSVDPKTETRRTQRLGPVNEEPDGWLSEGCAIDGRDGRFRRPRLMVAMFRHRVTGEDLWIRCPYGMPGDLLWTREVWADDCRVTGRPYGHPEVLYRADMVDLPTPAMKWSVPMFMPRRYARCLLEVTDIGVERVQAITEAGAVAEGMTFVGSYIDGDDFGQWWEQAWTHDPASIPTDYPGDSFICGLPSAAVAAYRRLFDAINISRGQAWERNPWVWVIRFRLARMLP